MSGRKAYIFKVRTYECDAEGFATMPSICNYLQEAASLNAGELGFSKSDFEDSGENISWVLTRLSVRISSYPEWGDEISVETFPRGGRKIAAWRDFLVKDVAGAVIGAASSEWMLIDLATRRMIPVPASVLACADPADEPVLGADPFPRLRFPVEAGGEVSSFRALKAHEDLNGHVNNVHYMEWMFEHRDNSRPAEMDVVFRGEALAGDEVLVRSLPSGESVFYRVFSASGKDHIIARASG